MAVRRTRETHKWINENPEPVGTTENLQHTLKIFSDVPDDRFVVIATSNVYDDGTKTGLTFGDLRAIAQELKIEY